MATLLYLFPLNFRFLQSKHIGILTLPRSDGRVISNPYMVYRIYALYGIPTPNNARNVHQSA